MLCNHTLSLHNMRIFTRSCTCATLLLAIGLSGCSDQKAPRLSTTAEWPQTTADLNSGSAAVPAPIAESTSNNADAGLIEPQTNSITAPTDIDPAITTPKGHPKQWWEAIYAYGSKIGWCHTEMKDVEEAGEKLTQITSENHIAVNRQGQRIAIEIATTSVEAPTGEPIRFHTLMNAGASRTETNGRIADGQLTIETKTAGKSTTESFPWTAGTLGFGATEQSLAAAPLLPGQHRTLRAMMPATNEVVTIELAADKIESTPLIDHTEDLLQIESAMTLPMGAAAEKPSVLRSQLWTNRQGEVLKTSLVALNQETYRTSREAALSEAGPRQLDLVFDNTVPVARPLADPHATRRVRYRVQLSGEDPARVFSACELQEVQSLDPHTAEITVRRYDPSDNSRPDDSSIVRRAPSEDDRAPNNLIQSDDDRVQALAHSVAPDENDPVKLGAALEAFVKKTIKLKDFSQAFATAAEVARVPEGDCTEHAVLLAALARARGIPARVAIGLVYQSATQSFVYHMWNELWIADRWVPMDATLGRGGIGAAHLKLTDSNLAGAAAYSCFLPVAQVIGQLKIEILEVE
jgi:hypothetical protein